MARYVLPAGETQADHVAAAARALALIQRTSTNKGAAATARRTLATRQLQYQLHYLPTATQTADLEELQHYTV